MTTPSTTTPLRWTSQDAKAALADPAQAREWDRLNAQRRDLPFLAANAVHNALTVFGDGRERLLVGHEQERVRAMFVLVPAGTCRWQTFQPSQLPLGSWVADADLELTALTDSLIRGPLGLCLALSVTQVDPLLAPRQPDTDTAEHGDYIETAWIDIEGSFDTYWAARGKNLRQNMRKQRNKLAAEGRATEMRVLRHVAEMAPALQRYGVLESVGWKSGHGTAIHPDNDQGRFYLRLLEQAAVVGEARVYEYLFDQQTVAMNLCLLRNGQLIVLKTTYDESIKTLSPAFLLREEELQSFFAGDEVRRIEYYGRVMDWHTKFTDNQRTVHHLTRYRWAWVHQLALYRRKTAEKSAAEKVADKSADKAIEPAASTRQPAELVAQEPAHQRAPTPQ